MVKVIPGRIADRAKKELKKEKLDKKSTERFYDELEKRYHEAKIDPGESIGIITAESFGEPSTQMSTSYDEKIMIKQDNKIKIIRIGEFVDGIMEKHGFMKFRDSNIVPVNNLEVYVPSLDQDEKIKWKKVVECSRHESPEKLIEITTYSGRKIVCTDNHSFVTRMNNKVIPINGRDLKIGNRIPVVKNLKLFVEPMKNVQINQYVDAPQEKLIVNEEGMLSRIGTIAKPILNNIELNGLTGWFVGAYLAEGFSNLGQVGISNIYDSYIDNAKKFADSIHIDYKDRFYDGEYGMGRMLSIHSSFLARFIKSTCKSGSKLKEVPEFAYNCSEEFVSGLLRGYFDGDGNIAVDRKMIRVYSNSEELIKGISLLLRRFSIFSHKKKDNKGQHWLLIPYKYAPLFLEKIGSDIEYKKEGLEKLAEMAKKFWDDKSNDYTDMISGFGNLFYDTAKKLGYRTRYINNFTKRQKIGRTTLFRYIKIFEDLADKLKVDISEELKIMKRMFYSDIVWDEIKEIKYVKSEHRYVYDLSVPGLETFTTFDGIVTHNTLNVFHFAGVAEVSVTVGLPRLIEIFDARKEPSTPMMEVYLKASHSNDTEKVRKIAALIKETRAEEFISEISLDILKMAVYLKLNNYKLKEVGIDVKTFTKTFSKSLKNISIRELKEGDLVLRSTKQIEVQDLYKLKEKIKGILVSGIKNITQVLPIKKGNEFVIICAGTNLRDITKVEGVDVTRTMSNNFFEIAEVLGIEAARTSIIEEARKVIKEQGLDIDIRHIMLVADVMTNNGKVQGITRTGITGEKESVLARASFETPVNHLVNASLIGEVDMLNSVIENVMVNQAVPTGTGLPGLLAKMKDRERK